LLVHLMLFERKKKLVDCSSRSLHVGGSDFMIYCKFIVRYENFFIERRS
jgi:hypothetical protein